MTRCNACNKFVGVDLRNEVDITVDSPSSGFNGEAVVNLDCGTCGRPVKEARFTINVGIQDPCSCFGSEEPKYDVEVVASSITNRRQQFVEVVKKDGTVRRYPIKHIQYMKKFYGFKATLGAKCSICGQDWQQEVEDEVQASFMEAL